MKISEAEQKRIDEGMNPEYITNRGKLLWVDQEHYDNYASAESCKRLIDATGIYSRSAGRACTDEDIIRKEDQV